MKSRRKIWSIPVALAVVLMFAAMIGVSSYVAAQAGNAAPKVATPLADAIGDTVLELEDGDPDDTTVDLAAVFDDTTMAGDPAVEVDDRLAFTVMTNAPNTASAAFTTGTAYNDDQAPDNGVVANWWNSLDQAKKRAVVGVKLDNTLDAANVNRGTCDNAAWCFSYDHDGVANTTAITVIGAYGAGIMNDSATPQTIPEITDDAQEIVTQAFHWDMLTGAEMVAAARAGGIENPNNYAKPFRQLTEDTTDAQNANVPGQRTNVQALYSPRTFDHDDDPLTAAITHPAVLQRGQGSGDLDGQTEDEEQVASLTVTAGDTYADIGTATITVKASDSAGRLIPPDTGRETVGDSVDIEVNGKVLADLQIPRTQTGVTFEGDNDLTPNTVEPDTFVFIIEGTANTVGAIDVVSSGTEDATAHAGIDGDVTADPPVTTTFDDIRGRLRDGAGFPFRVNQTGVRDDDSDVFTISVPEGMALSLADSPYEFTFEAYALSNIVNVTSIEIRVELAVGNQPPVFTAAALAQTEMDVSEVTKVGDTIATFSASDPDNTTGISYSVSGGDGNFEIDNSGKLKVAKALDYQGDEEASGEDPEAADYVPAEEAGDDNENNIFELTITATDGEHTATHTFTVTVTDSPDVPATGSRAFTIDENTVNGDDAEEGEDPDYYLVDSDGAKAKVLLLNDEGVPVEDTFTYEIDERNSPEVEVALFDIQDGRDTLPEELAEHLTSRVEDRYLLSVKATDNTATPPVTQSGAVIITVANVAEMPDVCTNAAPTCIVTLSRARALVTPLMDTKGDALTLTNDVPAVFDG